MKHPTQEQLLNAAAKLDDAYAMLVSMARQQAAEPVSVPALVGVLATLPSHIKEAVEAYGAACARVTLLATHSAPVQQAAEPVGEYVIVGRAELAMVRNALQRDADEGKQSRKAMLRALDESARPAQSHQQAQPNRTGCAAGSDEECTNRRCATNCPALTQQAAEPATSPTTGMNITWPNASFMWAAAITPPDMWSSGASKLSKRLSAKCCVIFPPSSR